MSQADLEKLERICELKYSKPILHRIYKILYRASFPQITGYLDEREGAMLHRWASTLKNSSVILEIGTLNGLSTCYLAKGAMKSNSMVYSIDPFNSDKERQIREWDESKYILKKKRTKEEVNEDIKNEGLAERVELIEGFSLDVAPVWNKQIDFLWIDGNHNQVAQDYEAWRKFLRDGSRVAFHDATPRFGRANIVDYVRKVVRKENLSGLEQVRGIVSFLISLDK